jgi:co-chaperonin GroES (HSP10)
MKFRPLGDRVVVRRIKEDTKTAGGIIIPAGKASGRRDRLGRPRRDR